VRHPATTRDLRSCVHARPIEARFEPLRIDQPAIDPQRNSALRPRRVLDEKDQHYLYDDEERAREPNPYAALEWRWRTAQTSLLRARLDRFARDTGIRRTAGATRGPSAAPVVRKLTLLRTSGAADGPRVAPAVRRTQEARRNSTQSLTAECDVR